MNQVSINAAYAIFNKRFIVSVWCSDVFDLPFKAVETYEHLKNKLTSMLE